MTQKYTSLVSVIIPTYKRADCLLSTINSVLNQTHDNIEIIIVDDNGEGSIEQQNTEILLSEYIKSNKVKYVKHIKNKNGSAARNTGFMASNGEYINFMDDDDEMLPFKISSQVKCLENTKDDSIGACYCNSLCTYVFKNKVKTMTTNINQDGNLCLGYLKGKYFFNTSAILFKRETIIKLNGFDESFTRHQDYELMTRFFCEYNILCASLEPLLVYDTTKIRTYCHNAEKDYNLKKKFLNDLKPYLEKLNIYKEISHHFWFCTAQTAILSGQYKYLYYSLKNSLSYGIFAPNEIKQLTKLIIKRFIGKV